MKKRFLFCVVLVLALPLLACGQCGTAIGTGSVYQSQNVEVGEIGICMPVVIFMLFLILIAACGAAGGMGGG